MSNEIEKTKKDTYQDLQKLQKFLGFNEKGHYITIEQVEILVRVAKDLDLDIWKKHVVLLYGTPYVTYTGLLALLQNNKIDYKVTFKNINATREFVECVCEVIITPVGFTSLYSYIMKAKEDGFTKEEAMEFATYSDYTKIYMKDLNSKMQKHAISMCKKTAFMHAIKYINFSDRGLEPIPLDIDDEYEIIDVIREDINTDNNSKVTIMKEKAPKEQKSDKKEEKVFNKDKFMGGFLQYLAKNNIKVRSELQEGFFKELCEIALIEDLTEDHREKIIALKKTAESVLLQTVKSIIERLDIELPETKIQDAEIIDIDSVKKEHDIDASSILDIFIDKIKENKAGAFPKIMLEQIEKVELMDHICLICFKKKKEWVNNSDIEKIKSYIPYLESGKKNELTGMILEGWKNFKKDDQMAQAKEELKKAYDATADNFKKKGSK